MILLMLVLYSHCYTYTAQGKRMLGLTPTETACSVLGMMVGGRGGVGVGVNSQTFLVKC